MNKKDRGGGVGILLKIPILALVLEYPRDLFLSNLVLCIVHYTKSQSARGFMDLKAV